MTLSDYWRAITRYGAVVVLLIVLGAGAAAIKDVFMPTRYQATAQILLAPGAKGDGGSAPIVPQPASADRYVNTQSHVVLSAAVLGEAATKLSSSVSQIRSEVTSQQLGGTDILTVSAETNSPSESVRLANTVAGAYLKYESAAVRTSGLYGPPSELSSADYQVTKTQPLWARDLLIGGIAGLVVGLGVAVISGERRRRSTFAPFRHTVPEPT